MTKCLRAIRTGLSCLIVALCLCFQAGAALAQSTAFTYQGKLSDGGSPASGNFDIQVGLFDTATQLGGVSASGFIQNTTAQQTGTNFNVGGNGTVGGALSGNTVNAATQFNIAGSRILSNAGTNNLFAGSCSGIVNTGSGNSFVGAAAGFNNTTGSNNSFVGSSAGAANTTGFGNSFAGALAGQANVSGSQNSFFGSNAGFSNTIGASNSFFGAVAGQLNTTGVSNSFFGAGAGGSNTTGGSNAFVGTNAGFSSTGDGNSFLGSSAGQSNTTGSSNTILGASANVGAGNLSFATALGAGAVVGTSNTIALGRSNGSDTVQIPGALSVTGSTTFGGTLGANIFNATTQYNIGGFRALSLAGNANTFVGLGTGQSNSTGFQNSFVGANAGASNTTGGNNSFFGQASGFSNTDGGENSFVGFTSGFSNTLGNGNSFFGRGAGASNTTGSSNTIVGYFANVGANNLTNATALGAGALVSQSNSLVLGNNVNVGIGTAAPMSRLHLNANNPSFAVTFTNSANTARRRGYRLAFDNDRFSFQRADDSGNFVDNQVAINQATGNVGIGDTAPLGKLQVVTANDTNPSVITAWDSRHFVLGESASSGGIGLSYDQTNNVGYITAVSPNVSFRNLVLQSAGGNVGIGTTAPQARLHVNGIIRVDALAGAGVVQLCLNAADQISVCSSSLRYKTDIKPFNNGLNSINRLRPIAFIWKDGGMKDVGFGAEDVEKISPLLVAYNSAGLVEGVKYDRLSVVFVNAFKEQQPQIESLEKQNQSQQEQLERQQKQIDSLKQIVCSMNPRAGICKRGK